VGINQHLQAIPLSLGDVAMYVPLVIIVSILLNLAIFGIKAGILRRKRAISAAVLEK
jgi:hypothetical protein